MADFKWFGRWNRDNPTNVWGPGILAGTVGGAIIVATLIVTQGYPWAVTSIQTGPRGLGMEVTQSGAAPPDASVDNLYTEPPVVPQGGETLARDVYQNVPLLGDLTEDNFNRLMLAITAWVSPDQGCAYCHGEEGDFASDALYTKRVSSRMIQMNWAINDTWADHVAPAGVTCYTCHRGENVPSNVWFDVTPVNDAMAGWSAVQNRVTPHSESTSLPSDALMKYLVEYEPIRVHDLEPRVENIGTASIQAAERTFSLMNHMSNALGVNCTYCHNTRAPFDLLEATPQLALAQLGIAMSLDINNTYLLPLADELPQSRLGPKHGDVPKVACATCHKGYAKPIGGINVIDDWPELRAEGPPVYE